MSTSSEYLLHKNLHEQLHNIKSSQKKSDSLKKHGMVSEKNPASYSKGLPTMTFKGKDTKITSK